MQAIAKAMLKIGLIKPDDKLGKPIMMVRQVKTTTKKPPPTIAFSYQTITFTA